MYVCPCRMRIIRFKEVFFKGKKDDGCIFSIGESPTDKEEYNA